MLIHDSASAQAVTPEPLVQAAISSVARTDLQSWVKALAHPRHRIAQAAENQATAEWLVVQFLEWGYEVELQGPYHNVVASSPNRPKKLKLVGAHYDSMPGTPGADDNASAVAALLGSAKATAQQRDDILFVAFNGEEEDLTGSREFVRSYLPRHALEIEIAHVLEMVGYTSSAPGSQRVPPGLPIQLPDKGDFLGLVANQHSSGPLTSALAAAKTYTPGLPVAGLEVLAGMEVHLQVLLRSDHAPFWEKNLPAMMWTDTAEFRNPNYHKSTDTPESLDYDFLQAVTRMLVATLLTT